MELQQTSLYRTYIQKLGWSVLTVDDVAVFYRKLPLIGTMAKIQRPIRLPYLPKLIPELQKIDTRVIVLEPDASTDQKSWTAWVHMISKFFRIISSPYLPSKTITIDIKDDEQVIFKRFTEAKQRAIRKAVKNGIVIQTSHNLSELIKVKSKAAGMFGNITTYGLTELADVLGKTKTLCLLAYKTEVTPMSSHFPYIFHRKPHTHTPIAGVFMIFDGEMGYYWIAGATHEAKKLFAPTLLVWEAIKEAKKHGCSVFDFVGVWDERMPRQNKEWLGFTKFKEGFGGTYIYYPVHEFMKR